MKMFSLIRKFGLLVLVLGFLAGCASTPEETQPDPQAVAAQAIADAKVAVEKAKAEGALWRDTEDMLAQAEEAFKAGDYAKATKLANEARKQAEDAMAQKKAEMDRLNAEKAAKADAEAKKGGSYTVARGDSLWGISGKSDVYGNPYQWPLLYKANRDKIKDADLIYPGQKLSVERGMSQAAIDAAVKHAKTRGAWSLGTVESSDKAYLAK